MRPALLLGAVLLAAAIVFDAEPLVVPAVTLLGIGVLALAWVVLGTVGTRVEREVGAHRVLENEPLDIHVRVTAPVALLPGSSLDDPIRPEPVTLRAGVPTARVRLQVRFGRRGRRRLDLPALEVRDPLGLTVRRRAASGEAEHVLVLPRIEPVVAAGGAGEGGAFGRRRSAAGAAEVELDGLRPHRPGTPAARLFWPSLARGGELLERKLLPEAEARPVVVLDARGGEAAPEDLDCAVRAAASLALHLARVGGCAVLLPGDRRPALLDPPLHGWSALHVRLALLEGGGAPSAAAIAARRGPVLWVSARRTAAPPRGLVQASSAQRVLVVPGAVPGRRALFTVAGCTGYALAAREAIEAA
jgi:uncharacterized protein (DUF58 family)